MRVHVLGLGEREGCLYVGTLRGDTDAASHLHNYGWVLVCEECVCTCVAPFFGLLLHHTQFTSGHQVGGHGGLAA